MAKAAVIYAEITGENDFPKGAMYPHAGNIAKKLKDYQDANFGLGKTIANILIQYQVWRKATLSADLQKFDVIAAKVKVFDTYSAFLDTETVDAFDSRGALVSSALEEFCYYLLKPLLDEFPAAMLGKQDAYQGLYFTASNFRELLSLPTAHTPVNTLDFVIGAHVRVLLKVTKPTSPSIYGFRQ